MGHNKVTATALEEFLVNFYNSDSLSIRGAMWKFAALVLFAGYAASAGAQTSQPEADRRFQTLFSDWPAGGTVAERRGPAVVVSKAGDALGRPIDFSRVAARTIGQRALPGGAAMGGIGAVPSLPPLASASLTSGFGLRRHPVLGGLRLHSGIDLAAPSGTAVIATSDGIVSLAKWLGGYGLLVALDHGRGLQTRYGHLSRMNVAGGQFVRKGDVIGFVGSTGRSTGPHLHYEVRMGGQAMNPAAFMGVGR